MRTALGPQRIGCELHFTTDCGCPGYPTLSEVLRDCGRQCQDEPHTHRCLRCQAADIIDQYKRRSARYLERVVELQEELEAVTPPAGYIAINVPIDTVERIVETDRMFHALDELRDSIHRARDSIYRAWEGE